MKIKIYQVGYLVTNCYLVWDEGSGEAMVIDPGANDPAVKKGVSDNGLILKYIALTHGHCDHIGGVEGLTESFPDAVLAAGGKEAALLAGPEINMSPAVLGKSISLEAGLSLDEGDVIKLGHLSFQVIETPGHTPGGLTFYVEEWDRGLLDKPFSGTAFTGDTLFQSSHGRTDLPCGDYSVLVKSIREKLFALPDDTIVLPGHMDVTTIGNEKKYNPAAGRGQAL
ncbi:MAG: MBL fold metallo-hydrolase [Clostridiales bacterium]|nr:MBL fold metallo-hydrolase [Clostridiales bacterium]